MRVSKVNGIACKSVIEGRRDVFTVTLHSRVFVGAGVESGRDQDESGLWCGGGGGEEASGFPEEDLVLFVVESAEVGF